MEKDFHYFLIYAISKITGNPNADITAYASQFVDDNNEGQFSVDGRRMPFPSQLDSSSGYYYPIMTQSMSPKSLSIDVQKYVYVPFHFLPGDNTVEIDGKKNVLNTTPDSKNARALLKHALDSDNPYLIGIAAHTFADTWSHQNFTGLHEDWNSVYPWYNVVKSIAPNVGHAEAGHSPDVIDAVWIDYRFGDGGVIISNRERALKAIKELYIAFRKKWGNGPTWTEMKKSINHIIQTPGYDQRIEVIDQFLNDNQYGGIPRYNKNTWIDEALEREGVKFRLKDNFHSFHWYNFHQAAKDQFAFAMNLIKDI